MCLSYTHHDSSVGMALAAMEALNNLNLFGDEVCDMGLVCVMGMRLFDLWYRSAIWYENVITWYGNEDGK